MAKMHMFGGGAGEGPAVFLGTDATAEYFFVQSAAICKRPSENQSEHCGGMGAALMAYIHCFKVRPAQTI